MAQVRTPDGKDTEIANPLYAFCLPKSLGTGYPGAQYNPTGAPFYKPLPGVVPYTPEGYSTVRVPDNNCQTQVGSLPLFCHVSRVSHALEVYHSRRRASRPSGLPTTTARPRWVPCSFASATTCR